MSVRSGVRAYLAADSAYMALLPGGLYPDPALTPSDQAELTRDGTPAAFDSFGDLKAAGLVVSDGAVAFPGLVPHAAQDFIRIMHWQRAGRDAIEAANQRAYTLLDNARLSIDGHYCRFRWAAFAQSSLTDPSLRDAPLSWSRWQVIRLLA